MKNLSWKNLSYLTFLWIPFNLQAQCVNPLNIYSFDYNGHSYELVKEKRTWPVSVACAIERGGYLAEINDLNEQDSIFNELINRANIIFSNTLNIFSTSSIWIGGTDSITEGIWLWDGNNDGVGTQFWNGGPTGNPVNGAYTKWGTSPAEPDNSGGQDQLSLIIDNRRVNYGRWNDLKSNDNLFYLIEYNTLLNVKDFDLKIELYPNPFHNKLIIKNLSNTKITTIEFKNAIGQKIKSFEKFENVEENLDVSSLKNGMYFVTIYFETGKRIIKSFVKQ